MPTSKTQRNLSIFSKESNQRRMLVFIAFLVGLLVGVLATLGGEALGLLFLLRLTQKKIKQESDAAQHVVPQQSLDFAYNNQGNVWVLESEERKDDMPQKASPARKHAKIMDSSLVVTHSDGSAITIPLKGCLVEAVSASNLSSGKWAKEYPIKVESKTSPIYNGNKIIYLYLETSCEKESWCKALRLASCEDSEKLNWFRNLSEDFQVYLKSLNVRTPSLRKPSLGFSAERIDEGIWTNQFAPEERETSEQQQHHSQDSGSLSEENLPFSSSQGFSRSASQDYSSAVHEADSEQGNLSFDEGTLGWNWFISRIFFDIKGNAGLRNSIQQLIQRTLSDASNPIYIAKFICTGVGINFGSLPPYIHGMRLLPTDMNEVCAFEVDAEYSGGAVLDVGTKLEIHDRDFLKDILKITSESKLVSPLSLALLKVFKKCWKQFCREADGSEGSKATSIRGVLSQGKSFITNKYSQIRSELQEMPLSLSIKIVSLQGTMRVHIKAPPSDQLWFCFSSMPVINFDLEFSVANHKITSELLISRCKAALRDSMESAIREMMVLPNCNSVCIPWMLAEKDDWVHHEVASFIPENDSRPKKTGKRARMLDLGKKVGKKMGEKFEEKSRHIVEKMRGALEK